MRHCPWKAVCACIFSLFILTSGGAKAGPTECHIYDGTIYQNKPAERPGMLDIHVVYQSDLWNPQLPDAPLPWRPRVEAAARTAEARNVPLVFDIERWPVDATVSDEQVALVIGKLLEIVQWARAAAPTVKLGYFTLAPMAASSWAVAPKGSEDNLAWRRANDRMRPLADAVDIIFPYVYTYKNNPAEWEGQALGNIREAHRYGKPVYVFIWPQYTERDKELGYTFIPSEFWRRQLAVACEQADGVVIWGGWDPKLRQRANWDDSAQWYRDVQVFLGLRSE